MKQLIVMILLTTAAFAASFTSFLDTGVSQGQRGWLFHVAEYGAYQQEQSRDIEDKLRFIAGISQAFKEQGVQLLVALVPGKIHLYESELSSDFPLTDTIRSRYTRALQMLQTSGVQTVDLLTPMSVAQRSPEEKTYPIYQKLDHHFSSRGALVAAKAVADSVRKIIPAADLPVSKFMLKPQPKEYYEESSLLQRLPKSEQAKYPKEAFIPYELERSGNSLFSSQTANVVLVGSSASKGGRLWAFEYGIPFYLASEVVNAAQIGRGPWLPLEDYLTDPSYQNNKPKVIIWQLWEAFLLDVDQAMLPEDWAARLGALIADGSPLPKLALPSANLEISVPSEARATDSMLLEVSSPSLERLKLEVIGLKSQKLLTLRLGAIGQRYRLKIPLALAGDTAQRIRLLANTKTLQVFKVQRMALSSAMQKLLAPLGEQNLLARTDRFALRGFADLESNGVRWALGASTSVGFWSLDTKPIQLEVDVYNPIEKQEVTWLLNGAPLEIWRDLKAEENKQRTFTFTPLSGKNILEMRVKSFNGNGSEFAKTDARPLSVMFNRFSLIF